MLDLKWLNDCMQAGEFLYGAYPLAVLKKLYETMKGYTVAKRELAEQCEAAEGLLMTYVDAVFPEFEALGYQEPGYFMPLVVREGQLYDVLRQAEKDGIPYAGLHLDEEAVWELLGEQGDVEFAIPTADEIASLAESGYIRSKEALALEEKVTALGGNPDYVQVIWPQLSADQMDLQEAVNDFIQGAFGGKAFGSFDEANEMLACFTAFCNMVPHRNRRGWKPTMLRQKMGNPIPTRIAPGSVGMAKMMKEAEGQLKEAGLTVDYSSISDYTTIGKYGERRVVKVGRNDPCPCGSGKKFKRCHGR